MTGLTPFADGSRRRCCHAVDEARGCATAPRDRATGGAVSPPKRQSVSRRHVLATMLTTLAAAPLGMLACSGLSVGSAAAAAPSTSKDDDVIRQTTPSAIAL